MTEDVLSSVDSKQAVHCGVTLTELTTHLLEISSARFLAAVNIVLEINSKHFVNTRSSNVLQLNSRNFPPIIPTAVDRTRINIVGGAHSVHVFLAAVDLFQESGDSYPPPRARLLALVNITSVVNTPDVAVTRGGHVQQRSFNELPFATPVHWALIDLVGSVHSPHLLVVHVQLFQSSVNLLPLGGSARARAHEDLVRGVDSPEVVDVGRDVGQSS